MKINTITIDGPTSSGKGTISKLLAKKLGWSFLDSGMLYRAIAYCALKDANLDLSKTATIKNIIAEIKIDNIRTSKISYKNRDISKKIRSEECSKKASEIAANQLIRKAVLAWQRKFATKNGLVADGRDMGTVVFPNASLKIFLTAQSKVRAIRRYEQLKNQGINVSLNDVLRELRARDKRDREREASPLIPAKDAVIVDTTKMTIDEVVEKIFNLQLKIDKKNNQY